MRVIDPRYVAAVYARHQPVEAGDAKTGPYLTCAICPGAWPCDTAGMFAVIAELAGILRLCLSPSVMDAPEDGAVNALCEQWGYGAVMVRAAALWQANDSRGAFTCGPCVATVKAGLALLPVELQGDGVVEVSR